MERCQVLIVGGGPAGSTCAWKLRRAGVDVVVLDKAEFPRDKTCAGWITPAVVGELELDAADYARDRVFQPLTGFRTGTIGGPAVNTRYEKPVSFGILRRQFDHYLLERSGARLRLGEKLQSLERADGRWIVNGTLSAALLVGAGGHFCPVARHLGAAAGPKHVVAAQEIEFELSDAQKSSCQVQPDTPELYFCRDLQGYAWCFRKGDFLNVGLGREDTTDLSAHVAEFRRLMIAQGRIPPDTPVKFHGHAYILYGHVDRPLVDESALLIGDAAGLAYAQSGEGIRPAVESGLIAAGVIVRADGRYDRETLEPYARRLTAHLGRRNGVRDTAPLLPRRLKQAIAARLLATGWFTRRVVLDRWFLHAHVPALN